MGNPTLLVAYSERRPAPVASKILAFAFPVVRCRGKRLCWSLRPADHLMKESLVNRIGRTERRVRRYDGTRDRRRHVCPAEHANRTRHSLRFDRGNAFD
jgi:hypothetical protein